MRKNSPDIPDEQRTGLLRAGVIVLESDLDGRLPRVVVTGTGRERVERVVAEEFGTGVDVEIVGALPRSLLPRRCVGHMEREAGRLQLRFVLRGDEHVDDIVLAEDDEAVVVFATVCTSAARVEGDAWEGPWHVYLDRPLGDRLVIDGVTGKPVPYTNVLAQLRSEWPADPTPHEDGEDARAGLPDRVEDPPAARGRA
jgi:hypothetical protein